MAAFEVCEDISLLPQYLSASKAILKPLTKIFLREM